MFENYCFQNVSCVYARWPEENEDRTPEMEYSLTWGEMKLHVNTTGFHNGLNFHFISGDMKLSCKCRLRKILNFSFWWYKNFITFSSRKSFAKVLNLGNLFFVDTLYTVWLGSVSAHGKEILIYLSVFKQCWCWFFEYFGFDVNNIIYWYRILFSNINGRRFEGHMWLFKKYVSNYKGRFPLGRLISLGAEAYIV